MATRAGADLMFDSLTSFRAAPRTAASPSRVRPGSATQTLRLGHLWWAAILLLGLSASAVGWTIWQLRVDAVRTAVTETGHIATVLADQMSRSLKTVDAVLIDIARSTRHQDISTPEKFVAVLDRRTVYDTLLEYRTRVPQLFNLVIANRDGQVVVSTAAWPALDVNVADRDYFRAARDVDDGQLKTSLPIYNLINGQRTVVFARRLQTPDGTFQGVVFAAVSAKYFENIYGAVQSVHSLLFTLINPDGVILFRHPDDRDSAGKVLSNRAEWLEALTHGDASFRIRGQADGNIRYVSVRRVPDYPLIVDISVTENTSLETWRARAGAIGFGSVVFMLFSLYLLASITRQVRYLRDSEASLAQKSGELEHMARYDALTGLANRALFMEKIASAFERMQRHGEGFAVLMLDLDRFKTVNDSLGHPAGDALLKEIARRLRRITREVDCVARLGGDEFAVLQGPEKDQRAAVTALCERILKCVAEPVDLGGRKLVTETSIGVAFAPHDGGDADELIKNADLALYKAKGLGRNRAYFFETALEAETRERQELEDDMRRGIARGEFELHYQTVVDLAAEEWCGAEALVRWRHPERGLIYPNQFIPVAEDSGLIIPLGAFILRRACADAVGWPRPIKVAVNISPAQFQQSDLVGVLRSALADTGLPAERLELEITESVLLQGNEENLAVLHEIKKLGVSIVLDDFGIGYSSMMYLQMFPFDRIKIDQSFIRKMTHHDASAAIVCAIAGLGRSLDIATTAEGVETEEQLVFLRSAGCQSCQGYLFSRPVPLAELNFDKPKLGLESSKAA